MLLLGSTTSFDEAVGEDDEPAAVRLDALDDSDCDDDDTLLVAADGDFFNSCCCCCCCFSSNEPDCSRDASDVIGVSSVL